MGANSSPPDNPHFLGTIPRHGTLIQLQNAQHQLQVNWQQLPLPLPLPLSATPIRTTDAKLNEVKNVNFILGAQRGAAPLLPRREDA